MIVILLILSQVSVYPSDAVVDSMITEWYETGWFAERYEVSWVAHIVITNVSSYGKYLYECDPDKYLTGVAHTVHVGFYTSDSDGNTILIWHEENCFLFYNAEDKWYIETVPLLPRIDERTSPHGKQKRGT